MSKFNMTRYEKMVFFRQLSMVYDSEISVFEGLDLIMSKSKKPDMKEFCETLKNSVLSGDSLSESLSDADIGVANHELKMIEIGEITGKICHTLSDMADGIERELEIDSKLKSAFRYPAILAALTLAVVIVLLVSVVPIFNEMLVESGAELGVLSSVIFSVSSFLTESWIPFSGVLVAVITLLYYYFKHTASGRTRADKALYKSIFTKNIKKNAVAVGFTKNLAILIESGISFSEALEILEGTVTSDIVKRNIVKARVVVEKDGDIDDAFKELSMFPEILIEIVGVASRSGHLVSALRKAEKIMRRDLDDSIERLSARVEPILIIVLSIIVGAILLSSIVPIFNILNSVG